MLSELQCNLQKERQWVSSLLLEVVQSSRNNSQMLVSIVDSLGNGQSEELVVAQ
jgi:hypothetical protein